MKLFLLCHKNKRSSNSIVDFLNKNLENAEFGCFNIKKIIECTNLKNAKNLTPEQVKQAKNWQDAEYYPEFRKKLGLPPAPAK